MQDRRPRSPADAELVLEGHIPPHYREDEGPFSEFQDYYVTGTGESRSSNTSA